MQITKSQKKDSFESFVSDLAWRDINSKLLLWQRNLGVHDCGVVGGVKTSIVTREDLILSKLVWARDANSELQRRDVEALLDDSIDRKYLDHWAARLGVTDILKEIAE